jgi:hypothetical protein
LPEIETLILSSPAHWSSTCRSIQNQPPRRRHDKRSSIAGNNKTYWETKMILRTSDVPFGRKPAIQSIALSDRRTEITRYRPRSAKGLSGTISRDDVWIRSIVTLQLHPASLAVLYAKIQNVIKRRIAAISQQQKLATVGQPNV